MADRFGSRRFEVNQLRVLFEAVTLLSRATNRMAAARRNERHLDNIRRAMLECERQASSGDELAINEANHVFHLAVSRRRAFFAKGLPGCACRVAVSVAAMLP